VTTKSLNSAKKKEKEEKEERGEEKKKIIIKRIKFTFLPRTCKKLVCGINIKN
jgi:hypothetical protein